MSTVPGLRLVFLILASLLLLIPSANYERTGAAGPAFAQEQGTPISILGTGASFPAPLYQRWFREFNKLHPEVQIDFQTNG